jgi:hypothetical protein
MLAAAAVMIVWITLLTPSLAWAQFYVRQPDVEKGESDVEEHGAIFAGPGSDEDLRQSHEAEFTHGLTDRVQLIVEGFLEQPIGESLQATEFEIGGQYQFIKAESDGRVGEHPEIDGLEFQYNWQLKHEITQRVAFGVEAFGEIKDLANPGSFNEQLHRAGPVIYLNLGQEAEGSATGKRENEETEHMQESEAPELKMAAGVLFGLSDATSDVTFKLDAELEF